MRILLWHVHGGWTDAFVRGEHEYLLPTTPEGGPWGLGRGGRDWPESARQIAPEDLRDAEIDVVVLQRTDDLEKAEELLGRRLGRDIPAVFVEHNTPRQDVPNSVHPLAERDDILVAHVTGFNSLFWDTGRAPTTVIEHGVVDPGELYTGELPRFGVVVNDPVRRWRVTGSDLLPVFAEAAPVDVYGMNAEGLGDALQLGPDRLAVEGDLPTRKLHESLARRRVYLHPIRWTSLGLSLIEAMHLGMPVVALATTEAFHAVPSEAGAVSTDLGTLAATARRLVNDPDEARAAGRIARAHALRRYGLHRFLADWDAVLGNVVGGATATEAAEGAGLARSIRDDGDNDHLAPYERTTA